MSDVQAVTDRVFRVSNSYRALAGRLLARGAELHRAGELDEAAFASIRRSSDDLLMQASDMLVDLDDALAQRLSAPLTSIEQATGELKMAGERVAQVTDIVSAALGVVAAAAAVAVFVGAPGVPSASAAVSAIAAAVKTFT
jgi:hypothetical protein